MNFTELSPYMQNIVLYNYDIFMKLLFLGVFFVISIFYLFYYKPKLEKPTVLWSVMLLRTIVTGFSFIGLLLSPFILLTLDPRYTFDSFFEIYGLIYGAILILIMFVIMLDFTKWAFILVLRMSGIKTDSEQYRKFKRWYKTYINPK